MRHLINALCLAAVLSAPIAIRADGEHHYTRYYDAERKDYHTWNEREELAYRRYLEERHREYRPYESLSNMDQREYWEWRHTHKDAAHDRDDR